jgi:ABC-type transport system substrate-binding protein
VTTNIRLVDKVTWLNGTLAGDAPFDMFIEDLAALLVVDQNLYLSATTAAWNSARHTDTKVDEFYARYARELDPAKRKAIAKEFQEFTRWLFRIRYFEDVGSTTHIRGFEF